MSEPIPEPNVDPDGLPELRTALQLCDDLTAAYDRLGVLYERLDRTLP